ncbi:lipocalin family protein [Muricauda sp. 334s03]|uniref:Lipocalin family protein n=1 Tax=Flagellimonas yonaguniensis TaxID=3031325 RepID=A0ABT5Y2L3_9FLAO|nr:lipocalin family protein [[Muricauda] yonaguniensis]MDF0717692.1 lipocalin family protein [[Muricauda] yonaguniensis]
MKTKSKLRIPHLIDAERDLAWKPGLMANSFFAIADVETQDGRKFNMLVHQLQSPAPADDPVQLGSIFNVFDITNGTYKSSEGVYTEDEIRYETDRMYVETPNSIISGDVHTMHVSANSDWGSLDLNMQFPGQVMYNAGTGVFDFFGNVPTGQYSIVNGLCSGTLTLEGEEIKFFGTTWFDRQWSWIKDLDGNKETMVKKEEFQGQDMHWTWMNLTLDNGHVMGLWDIHLYGNHSSFVTLVEPDGSHVVANIKPLAELASEYWISPKKQHYPTNWIVDIPELDAKLTVKAIKKEQEVASNMLPRYEGLANITGTFRGKPVTGHNLVEMVGNWSKG